MKYLVLFFFLMTIVSNGSSQTANSDTVQNDIKIFPNPATSMLNVLGLKNASSASISVTDIYGNQVISHQWGIKNNALNIPVFNLEEGMYLITIQSEYEQIQRKFYKK